MAGPQRALLDDASRISKENTAAAQRALKHGEEALQVAVATLGELSAQTCTLRQVSQSLDEADAHMAEAEATLDTINTRCLGCFGPKRKLSRRRSAKDSGGGDGRQTEGALRESGIHVFSRQKRLGSGAPSTSRTHPASSTSASQPKEYDKLASEAAKQDDFMHQLDSVVTELHAVSLRIGEETDKQQPALEGLSERAQELRDRFSHANTQGKMAYIDAKPRRGWRRK